ncbi:MAG: MurR/RpiR family transcriptional regulator [Tissierellaceae bacterium]|jgi:DNA-binding MurR/RpiR family transcriptional regulator|nr:MurR/RpiR family transcriptional regulator [Tissierellia bacterium]
MDRNIDLIKKIKEEYPRLSKGHKLIANFILEDYDKAAFMTAAALGQAIDISESTVVRFANRLGYEGYRDLQKDLQGLIKNKLTTIQRLNLAEREYSNDDTLPKLMERDMENIKKTINEINLEKFNEAVDIVLNAKKKYIVGLRTSSFLAGYLGFYLNFILDDVHVIRSESNDIFEQLLRITSDDVLIVITYPRYSKRIIEVVDFVREKNVTIISLTDSKLSPLAEKSDISLIAVSDMLSFIDSLVAPMSLINSFIISLGNKSKEDLNNYFIQLEEIWERYDIYERSET